MCWLPTDGNLLAWLCLGAGWEWQWRDLPGEMHKHRGDAEESRALVLQSPAQGGMGKGLLSPPCAAGARRESLQGMQRAGQGQDSAPELHGVLQPTEIPLAARFCSSLIPSAPISPGSRGTSGWQHSHQLCQLCQCCLLAAGEGALCPITDKDVTDPRNVSQGCPEQPFTSQPLVFKVLQAELKSPSKGNAAMISDLGDSAFVGVFAEHGRV